MEINKDMILAKNSLLGHTIAVCKDSDILISDKMGIQPMIDFIDSGINLNGYSVADMVVGKAVAMLFVKVGIKEVFAKTMSSQAISILEKHNIPYSYDIRTENIINRKGDGLCPMEQAVINTDNIEQGYKLIKNKLFELKNKV